MPYVIFYYIIICFVFSEAITTFTTFHKFYRKTPVLESLFFLKMMKLCKDICSAWICRTSAKFFILIDWHHKRLKNIIDVLLFCGEHFYGFLEGDLWKRWKKKKHFTTNISIYTGHKHFEVLGSFMKFHFVHIVKVCFVFKKLSLCLYSPIHA